MILELLLRMVQVYVFVASGGRWRAWARNSLALGYWSESSDLDITLYSEEDDAVPESILRLWRLFRPFGEWAAFTLADRKWLTIANPLELARDPRLLETLGAERRAPSRAEAFVFWLRAVGGGRWREPNLTRIGTRSRKWRHHLRELERVAGAKTSRPFPESVAEMGGFLSPVPAGEWPVYSPFLWPQEWLKEAILDCIVLDEYLRDGPLPMLEVASAQVRWEAWGLLSQLRFTRQAGGMRQHLTQLAQLFPAANPVRETIREFLEQRVG